MTAALRLKTGANNCNSLMQNDIKKSNLLYRQPQQNHTPQIYSTIVLNIANKGLI